jgi:hypothetical protein
MNRTTALLGAIVGAISLSGVASARPHIIFHGRHLHFQNHPFNVPGGVEVPFREMGQLIGAHTGRTPNGQRVFIDYHGHHVEYDKFHFAYWLDGQRYSLYDHSKDRNGVMYVPFVIFRAVTNQEAHFVDNDDDWD